MKTLILIAAAALNLTAAATAQTTTTVSFADLDVSSPAGKLVLAHRIANAARVVCDTTRSDSTLETYVAGRTCRDRAIASATKAVEAKLTPQYASR